MGADQAAYALFILVRREMGQSGVRETHAMIQSETAPALGSLLSDRMSDSLSHLCDLDVLTDATR
jgi:hypothetical protein